MQGKRKRGRGLGKDKDKDDDDDDDEEEDEDDITVCSFAELLCKVAKLGESHCCVASGVFRFPGELVKRAEQMQKRG
eukprot:3925944-Rhodomonas_salina.1